jgi:nucleotide-binding universal stress UspA family protein
MSYARLMVYLELELAIDERLKIACGIASRFKCDLIGVMAVHPLERLYRGRTTSQDTLAEGPHELQRLVTENEAVFRAALAAWGLTGEWRSDLAEPEAFVSAELRSADLIVTGSKRQAEPAYSGTRLDPASLIMRAGRPVLIIPPEAEELLFKKVLVAWKDSRECRRAVADSLPILKTAEAVHIIEIAETGELQASKDRLCDVCGWLRSHQVLATASALEPVGETAGQLAERAIMEGADLIVAGAYAHSRFREWILGGVTRDLLTRIPCCSLLSR